MPRKLLTIKVDLVVHGAAGLCLRDVHVDVEGLVLFEKVLDGDPGRGDGVVPSPLLPLPVQQVRVWWQPKDVRAYSEQCCGSGRFIPDPIIFHPGCEIFHPGSASKNLSILTQKIGF